jgi:inosine-uridine nucleoside N-ribohydrolase
MGYVIYDCDNTFGLKTKEIDDGLTIYYLLGSPDIELVGVTTTFGNGTIEQVYAQTQTLLADIGRSDIPVKRGTGKRGEGPTEAAHFLVETVAAHAGEISILATGPLGNLRAACEIDPEFFLKVKQVACMGGYLAPLRMGWRQVNELNLSADPEASHLVLNAPCPVTLMNAQTCLQAPFYWRDLRKLNCWSQSARWAVRRWLILHAIFCGLPNFYLWDLLPAVYLSYPDLFDNNEVTITSSVQDLETGSLIVADQPRGKTVNMPRSITDVSRFKAILFEAWQHLPA